jgi:two-component system, NarL family, sensor histidine kinase UhpB
MDLRFRLLATLSAGLAALLVAGALVVASSLREDVQDELEASARLVTLVLQAAQTAPKGSAATHISVDALLQQGGLRHVRVDWERSTPEQPVLHSVTTEAPAAGWATRLAGLQDWDFPEYRVPVGPDEQLLIRMDPRSEVDEVLEDAAWMLAVFLFFAGVSVAAAWWAADRALRPVRLLEEGLARIGRGELDQPLPPMALREYQRVAQAINDLARSLAQSQDGERRLGQRLMVLQESEREDLARELHDEFGQGLAAMGAAAAFVERHAESARPDALVECARDIRQASSRMAYQVRCRLRQLRPHGLEHMNLREAITELVYGSRLKAEGVLIETRLPDELPRLPAEAGLALYRTVQEALTNVLRHAQAARVRLEISLQPQGLQMTLDDDGTGRAEDVVRMARAGVMGMRERAALAGGRFELSAASLGGLRVLLWLPLAKSSQGELNGERAIAG